MAFLWWTWACNQLKPTTGQRITLKNTTTVDTLFDSWQLTITWMSIMMSTIKLNTDGICLGNLAEVMPGHYKKIMLGHYKKTANQIAHTIVAIHACIINCNNNILEKFFFLMALINLMMAIFLLWLCRPSQGHGSTEESRQFSGHCPYRKMQGTCTTVNRSVSLSAHNNG